MRTLTSLCRTLSSNPGFISHHLDHHNLPQEINLFKGLHPSCSSFQVDPRLRAINNLLLGKRTTGKSKFIRNLNIPYPNVPTVLRRGFYEPGIFDTSTRLPMYKARQPQISISNKLTKAFLAYNIDTLYNH